jgi:hypothetical protein
LSSVSQSPDFGFAVLPLASQCKKAFHDELSTHHEHSPNKYLLKETKNAYRDHMPVINIIMYA